MKAVGETKMSEPHTLIDDYISQFEPDIQRLLREIRSVIQAAAPEAEEAISYQMPTYVYHGNLVHFAAFKNHIGFYPAPSGIEAFKEEIAKYKWAKGSVQFPLDQPIPLDLIRRIVLFRVAENRRLAEDKKQKRNGLVLRTRAECYATGADGNRMTPFTERVVNLIKSIPAGKVATYGQIALMAGSPRGARQVARILHAMSASHGLPWHRVINAQGRIALSAPEAFALQKGLLEAEGIQVDDAGCVDLSTYRWLG
ncbi:MGMT family protein [Acidaminobacter hydrogenoformans]|uniref:Alkylated DNA nucleotide flippase Atl1, participates in nucleotide excision repair, Ada-like DNA-binding domain n=1 Tax=Acidaminobacter hydrogenoformans DSM 2784 TaxID=1120920 RepID=A0A1G5S5Z9_9FIRM|nr:MGMT family protein [Acidaminobacter hydrogenoformans]SCZ81775.1 Alkylated DNA nucleotide flippase Atl1, participates in nucleotide excision repair, Ada-like DNA-binding domain [Acidaminobacter hydrogenoformans DSM 2784]